VRSSIWFVTVLSVLFTYFFVIFRHVFVARDGVIKVMWHEPGLSCSKLSTFLIPTFSLEDLLLSSLI
jgi:hypothetical protein